MGKIPNIEVCIEIPFTDGSEGACTTTVSHDTYIIRHAEWTEARPKRLMIQAKEWSKIRKYWLKACRLAKRDGETCNITIQSIDKAVKNLDSIGDMLIP